MVEKPWLKLDSLKLEGVTTPFEPVMATVVPLEFVSTARRRPRTAARHSSSTFSTVLNCCSFWPRVRLEATRSSTPKNRAPMTTM